MDHLHNDNSLRDALRPTLEKIGKTFASTGLSPNFWTVTGFIFAIASAISYGLLGIEFGLLIGGILLLVSGFFDVVDGQVARITGQTSKKGSYFDSMFDKIAEVAIFLGILVSSIKVEPYLIFLAITLSLLVSYARAKADSLDVTLQGIGIGERAERLIVIAVIGISGAILGAVLEIDSAIFMEIAVLIVVIIAAVTLIHRMIFTAKNIKE